MKRVFFIVAAGAILFTMSGCTNPEVITDQLLTYPARSADSVTVVEPGMPAPKGAITLGRVAVVDRGTSVHCKYDQVLALAKKETARIGGNVLQIVEHRRPSLWNGTCHQIMGNMLLDGKIDTDSIAMGSYMDDFQNYLESALANEERFYKHEVARHSPANRLRLSGGVALDPDKLKTIGGNYRQHVGLQLLASYAHIMKNGLSFGLTYMRTMAEYRGLGDYRLDCLTPTLGLARRFANHPRWLYDISFGFGYAHYDIKDFHHRGGFGMYLGGGLDYLLSSRLAVGAELDINAGVFKKPEEVILDERVKDLGLGNFCLMTGLRYYF